MLALFYVVEIQVVVFVILLTILCFILLEIQFVLEMRFLLGKTKRAIDVEKLCYLEVVIWKYGINPYFWN